MLKLENKWYLLIILPMIAFSCKNTITVQKSSTAIALVDTVKPDWYRANYDQVVMVDDDLVVKKQDSYLIDLPLLIVPDSTYVFFLSARIPVELFKKSNEFYPDLQHFVLIVPDWKFYDEIAKEASKKGMCIEPATTNFYYSIKREDGAVSVDSIRCSGDDNPAFDFVKPAPPKNVMTVYRKESYGSVCCPRDPKWDTADKDDSFLHDFEQRNQLKVTKGRYVQMEGKEGEKNIYYTLPGLASAQRLNFLAAKNGQTTPFIPQLFAPQLVPFVNEGFNKMKELP
jgi:hypothetical protein